MTERTNNKTLLLEPVASSVENRDETRSGAKVHRIPRLCSLDGFAEGLKESRGINLMRLEMLTQLRVTTAETVYRVTVLEPFKAKILVEGGALFAGGQQVTLLGASLGRSFLKMRCIWIGLQMELHTGDCTVVTSPVSSIEVLEDDFPAGPFVA